MMKSFAEYIPKITTSFTKASVGIAVWIPLLPVTIQKDIMVVAGKKALTNPIKFAALGRLPMDINNYNPETCLK